MRSVSQFHISTCDNGPTTTHLNAPCLELHPQRVPPQEAAAQQYRRRGGGPGVGPPPGDQHRVTWRTATAGQREGVLLNCCPRIFLAIRKLHPCNTCLAPAPAAARPHSAPPGRRRQCVRPRSTRRRRWPGCGGWAAPGPAHAAQTGSAARLQGQEAQAAQAQCFTRGNKAQQIA